MLDDLLDKETQAKLINLAMAIETETVDYDFVLKVLSDNSGESKYLLYFLLKFNEMTRNAVNKLYDYKARKHLETCWRIR